MRMGLVRRAFASPSPLPHQWDLRQLLDHDLDELVSGMFNYHQGVGT
ncbi:hypothetical protein [Altererythrobacter ishigakiensis]|nr:hypothetical protein [Altererythrobacter ishigakiensis]